MTETERSVVEFRLFKLRPGTCEEFYRVSRDGTIPLMRKCGITVLAHGPSLNEDDCYYLVRMFSSELARTELSQSLYARPEWQANYDGPVMDMIDCYHTVVMPGVPALISAITAFDQS